jgi:hypothetical protein
MSMLPWAVPLPIAGHNAKTNTRWSTRMDGFGLLPAVDASWHSHSKFWQKHSFSAFRLKKAY